MLTQASAPRARKIVRARHVLMQLSVSAGIFAYFVSAVSGGAAQTQRTTTAENQAPAAFATKPDANLLQLMRGVMFPESNVIFAAQMDVSTIPHDELPAMSPNLLTSVYGGWQAVENSSLALAETARLLVLPGRTCANGKAVPVQEAGWVKYASVMHDAAIAAYRAAQTKNVDEMVTATASVSEACAACHNVYRSNRVSPADRCTPLPQ